MSSQRRWAKDTGGKIAASDRAVIGHGSGCDRAAMGC
jgi:hypothetical protein